jgi:hypothetical protein
VIRHFSFYIVYYVSMDSFCYAPFYRTRCGPLPVFHPKILLLLSLYICKYEYMCICIDCQAFLFPIQFH